MGEEDSGGLAGQARPLQAFELGVHFLRIGYREELSLERVQGIKGREL